MAAQEGMLSLPLRGTPWSQVFAPGNSTPRMFELSILKTEGTLLIEQFWDPYLPAHPTEEMSCPILHWSQKPHSGGTGPVDLSLSRLQAVKGVFEFMIFVMESRS